MANVVSAEIPVDYELEAIKAQSVAARTYTIYKLIHGSKHENADLCDDSTCCQAWITKEDRMAKWEEAKRIDNWNKIVEAVNSTLGEVVIYEGQVINAFFHSNSGGITETATDVWGGQNYPYLQAVETSGEEGYTQYSSEVVLTKEELLNKLKSKYNDIQIDFNSEESIKILDYTEGKRVKTIRFGNKEIARSRGKKYIWIKSH
ncbi:MAG: SpoIID/LytB domain-containing protein [Clostridia bacterium]|nr:SpoIID/LytB domain-containing protein [Clostridia bacterium]